MYAGKPKVSTLAKNNDSDDEDVEDDCGEEDEEEKDEEVKEDKDTGSSSKHKSGAD